MNGSSSTGTVVSSAKDPVDVEKAPGIVKYNLLVCCKLWSYTVTRVVYKSRAVESNLEPSGDTPLILEIPAISLHIAAARTGSETLEDVMVAICGGSNAGINFFPAFAHLDLQ